MVHSYASQTGLTKSLEKPKSGVQSKQKAEDGIKKAQKMLITWLTEEPYLYKKVNHILTPADFTEELYGKVAEKLFQGFKNENVSPADIISFFQDEEEQREVAALFNTKVEMIATIAEKEKAFHDILLKVKRNSLEYYSKRLGSDVSALNQVIAGKKALEQLNKTHISLKE